MTLGNLHSLSAAVVSMYVSLLLIFFFFFASFDGINHSEEYDDYRLGPVSLPSEPSNMRMVLWAPNTMNVKKIMKERKKINNKVFQGEKNDHLSKIRNYN